MKRLFKEVFKSLAKNKIVVICLTILIFLTSGIFTLFFDIKTSYSKTINSYETISRLHDLTVDLDINSTGKIPNGGFDQIDAENKKTNTPITFAYSGNGEQRYMLSFPKDSENYIKVNSINGWNSGSDKYIRTEDFITFYYSNLNNFRITDFIPNGTDEKAKLNEVIKFKNDSDKTKFRIYKKVGDKFEIETNEIKAEKTDEFTFKHDLKLNDLVKVVYSAKEEGLYVINPHTIFLNIKDKKASLKIGDYEEWKREGQVAYIKGEDVLKALNFEKRDDKWYFKVGSQTDASIKLASGYTTTEGNINGNDAIQSNFKLEKFEDSLVQSFKNSEVQYQKLDKDNSFKYSFPKEWIRKITKKNYFKWHRFKMNWNEINDEEKSNWKGAYFKYIVNLKKYDPELYESLKYFSIWKKETQTTYITGKEIDEDKPGKVQTEEATFSEKKDEFVNIAFEKAWTGKSLDILSKHNWITGNSYNSIIDIEKAINPSFDSTINKDSQTLEANKKLYEKITDNNEFKNKISFVREGSSNFAKKLILEEIQKSVGEKNLGLRQTLTVETVDEATSQKNAFHFINAGDENEKVNGIKLNVGKLKEEQLSKTVLNSSISEKLSDSFILKPTDKNIEKKIPSVYTKEIIKAILENNFTPNFKYFVADIRFEDYYDYYPNTEILRKVPSGKIVVLTNTNDEQKDNVTILGAIAMPKKDSYVLLTQNKINEHSNYKVWKKVNLNNKKDYLSLNDVYNYMVNNSLTIKGEIGENGWVWTNQQFKNFYTFPVAFGSINNEYTNDIIQNRTIEKLAFAIKKIIIDTDASKLFSEDTINTVFYNLKKAVEDNSYHSLLALAKNNNALLTKVLFDFLNNVIKNVSAESPHNYQFVNMNGNIFVKNLFNYIISYFEKQYIQSASTDEERDRILVEQIENITRIFGVNLNVIPFINMSLLEVMKVIKSKRVIFSFLKNLINSIDFENFSNNIQKWYKEHPYFPLTEVNLEYWNLSVHKIASAFFASVDNSKFKYAIKSLISEIDFNTILNPNSETSLYKKWEDVHKKNNTFVQADADGLKSFFKRLSAKKVEDGTPDPDYYKNINDGINELIDNLSVTKFATALEERLKQSRKTYQVEANGKVYSNFNVEILENSDYLASFISGLTSENEDNITGKISNFQSAIIKLFNLSDEVETISETLKIKIPKKSDSKISLLDIPSLLKLNIASPNSQPSQEIDIFNQEQISNILTKITYAKNNNQKLDLTEKEIDFLKTTVLATDSDLTNIIEIERKVATYKNFVSKLALKNYKNIDPATGKWLYGFDENAKEIASYSDLSYYSALINDKANVQDKELLKTLHSALAKFLVPYLMKDGDASMIKNTLNLYSLWIKLAYELNELSTIEQKIIKNPETQKPEVITIKNKKLTYSQIKDILLEFMEMSSKEDISKIFSNYDAVIDKIPGIGILGAGTEYQSKTLQIALAHAETSKLATQFQGLFETNSTIKQYFDELVSKKKISAEVVEDWKKILLKHRYEVVYNLGYIASSSLMPTNYIEALKTFISTFMVTESTNQNNALKPLVANDYEFDILYNITLSNAKLPRSLSLINFPGAALNPLTSLSFPQLLMSYALSNEPNKGNVAEIVKKLFNNLSGLSVDQIKESIIPLFDKFILNKSQLEEKSDNNVDLDISWMNYAFSEKLKDKNGGDLIIYGINVSKIAKTFVDKLIEPITIYNYITYTDAGSYLAKVNYGYLNTNKKSVYTGDLSEYIKNPIEMARFIASVDDKYKIKINTLEYLIIGADMTADYLYPVVNEENLQVDTKHQALLYVNQKGFDRIYSAYPTFAIKEYALVKSPTDRKGRFLKEKNPTELRNKFNSFIENVTKTSNKKAFLQNETNFLHPERVIRVVTIRKIVDIIKNATIYLVTLLIVLVSLIIFFIIKRYIESKNKVIGILRAQGYKVSEIAFAFSSFGWIPTIVGCFAGYIAGLSVQLKIMKIFSSYWTLENQPIPFNFLSMIITIVLPLIAVTLLIFLITLISLRTKAIELISGLAEVNVSKIAQKISSLFRRASIKTKFIISMAINNFWKMLSLFIAFSVTALISMFFLSSNNVFNKSIERTYEHRNYKYKLNLETPTVEGGPYVTYNKDELHKYLYVPNDLAGGASSSNGSQLDYDNPNFLRPGGNFNTDVIINKFDPVVLTKSSLDLLMDLSVEISPWDITYANMPETQRARVIQIFKRVSEKMQDTQNLFKSNSSTSYQGLIAVKDKEKYLADLKAGKQEDLNNRASFFIFSKSGTGHSNDIEKDELRQFNYVEWDANIKEYLKPIRVSTSAFRQEYRDFLIKAYKKIDMNDFFVSFGGIYWNDSTNEKYSHAASKINGKEYKIYGYYPNSKYIRLIDSKGNDLSKLLANISWKPGEPIPVVINLVSQKVLGLSLDGVYDFELLNHTDRFIYKSLKVQKPNTNLKFRVVGMSNTYINTEFVSRKDIIDSILGFDILSKRLQDARKDELNSLYALFPDQKEKMLQQWKRKYEAFNGVLSNDSSPVQTIDTLTTYSSLGFWGAASSFDVHNSSDEAIWNFFRRIFISNPKEKYVSVYEHIVNSYKDSYKDSGRDISFSYEDKVTNLLGISPSELEDIRKMSNPDPKMSKLAREILKTFFEDSKESIYGKDIMYGASFNVDSKDIEVGFISGISSTVNSILTLLIIFALIISIIILIVITNIMITSSLKAVATFSILGYTNNEKIALFFSNFIPTIVFAVIAMIPMTYALISIFNKFMLTTSQTVLPLSLSISTIILSVSLCLIVFAITSLITWKVLNKEKPIEVLKGK
ncbi:ABC transporter permease [Metamycoplasma hyosynoviae]|uniref:ABC transporter permease n=1 Tax=Metamycoplasma hyosynoviae TaxID=29559 RepID=UPI0023671DEB|nr:ABC transporter permease [Metamycoplasma hyosynoviae]MDD7897502.1 ABC transporter permease [Metamycoplasma hyosynoviae]